MQSVREVEGGPHRCRQPHSLIADKIQDHINEINQHSLDTAENLIKQHEAFITTMDTNDEKIKNMPECSDRLLDDNHFASEKIKQKADSIRDR